MSFQVLPEMVWYGPTDPAELQSLNDHMARQRIVRQNARQLDQVGHHVSALLRILAELDVATVPADKRAGLKTALHQLSVLASRRSLEVLTLILSSTPAGAGQDSRPVPHHHPFSEATTSAVSSHGADQP